jgi:hypothetical protein
MSDPHEPWPDLDERAGREPSPASFDITYEHALAARRAELLAIPPERVIRGASIHASNAASIAEGTAMKVHRLRDRLAAELGDAARTLGERLVVTARAARQADIELVIAKRPVDVSEQHAVVTKHYDFLRIEAQSLVNRDLLDRRELERAGARAGYRALLTSTLMLVAMFRAHLPSLAGKTPVTAEALDAAERDTQNMAVTIAVRYHGAPRLAASDLRDRALTALIREYEDIRRKVTYVRWYQGDADEIAPSFWANRKRRRRRAGEGEAPDAQSAPEPPGASNGEPPR